MTVKTAWEPRLVTIAEAAQIVPGLTKWRLRELCLSKTLPHIRAGRKVLINVATIFDFVENPGNYQSAATSEENAESSGLTAVERGVR
jgi:hypothetical protein